MPLINKLDSQIILDNPNQKGGKEELDRALAAHLNTLQREPNNVSILFKVAKLYEEKTKFQEAIKCYKKIINLRPKQYKYYLKLAKNLERQGKISKAIQTYQKAIELEPKQSFEIYKNLGRHLSQKELWYEAIAIYQKALELEPNSSECYLELGRVQESQSNIEQAIASYRKAIELNSQQPTWVYRKLANILQQEKKHKEAVIFYRKALEIDSKLQGVFYLNFSQALLHMGQYKEATISYKKSFEKHYFINYKHEIIFCNIHKNASELFRTMIVENSNKKLDFERSNLSIRQYVKENNQELRLNDFSYLNNPDFFKFVVLRNPFNRLVSGYLNKFVQIRKPMSGTLPVIKDVYKFLEIKSNSYDKGITFSQFVHYLARSTDDFKLNSHWRPQYTFLGLGLFKKFDYVGQFEKLDSVIKYLEEKFDFKIRISDVSNSQHIINYGEVKEYSKPFHDMYPEELRSLETFPKAAQLYTPELEELVRVRYSQDIAIYESEFDTTLNGYS